MKPSLRKFALTAHTTLSVGWLARGRRLLRSRHRWPDQQRYSDGALRLPLGRKLAHSERDQHEQP